MVYSKAPIRTNGMFKTRLCAPVNLLSLNNLFTQFRLHDVTLGNCFFQSHLIHMYMYDLLRRRAKAQTLVFESLYGEYLEHNVVLIGKTKHSS